MIKLKDCEYLVSMLWTQFLHGPKYKSGSHSIFQTGLKVLLIRTKKYPNKTVFNPRNFDQKGRADVGSSVFVQKSFSWTTFLGGGSQWPRLGDQRVRLVTQKIYNGNMDQLDGARLVKLSQPHPNSAKRTKSSNSCRTFFDRNCRRWTTG